LNSTMVDAFIFGDSIGNPGSLVMTNKSSQHPLLLR
jgi:hypothetical protein